MISIIIVSWEVRDQLLKCLDSIFQLEKNSSFEVIVVDNGSTDQSAALTRQKFPQVKIIELNNNSGFAYACNQGAKIANGNYLLFLNPDTLWHEEILDKARKQYEEISEPGVLGIKLLNQDLTVQKSIRKFPSLGSQIIVLSKIHVLFKKLLKDYLKSDFDYNQDQPVDQIEGAFFFVSQKVYEKINGFDEHFFIWFEEVDFCYQAKKLGLNNYYYANASLIHLGEESFKQVPNLKKQQLFNRSLLYYFKKNKSAWQRTCLWIFIPFNLFLTLIIKIIGLKPKHY